MRSPRLTALTALLAAAVVLMDQVSKALAVGALQENVRHPVLGGLLGLQLAFNPGTVLSIGGGSTWIFTVIGIAVFLILAWVALRTSSRAWALTIGLSWGGAAGNLTDRLLAAPGPGRGQVTDFLAYGHLFIGNLADIALMLGFAAGAFLLFRDASSDPGSDGSEALRGPPNHPSLRVR